jgi:hypothetical protein
MTLLGKEYGRQTTPFERSLSEGTWRTLKRKHVGIGSNIYAVWEKHLLDESKRKQAPGSFRRGTAL